MTEQAKTPHETVALQETLLRIASDMASNAIAGSSSVSTEGFMLCHLLLREAEAQLADLSARLRAREEEENQEIKDRLARRDEHALSERQPAAPTGIALIAAERQRQIQAEGWSAEHDDQYQQAELVQAAICYAEEGSGFSLDIQTRKEDGSPTLWPWKSSWWKPKDLICNLARAGALIAAELDRQLRADQPRSDPARLTPDAEGKATGSATKCLSCSATLARVTALEAEIARLQRYEIAAKGHLCTYDLADWLACGNHGGYFACEICEEADNGQHRHALRVRAEAAEARVAVLEAEIAKALADVKAWQETLRVLQQPHWCQRAADAEARADAAEREAATMPRIRAQAMAISELLRGANVGSCTLEEGVRILIQRADAAEQQIARFQEAFAFCEVHTPARWEGDGTCVICEGQRLMGEIAQLQAPGRCPFCGKDALGGIIADDLAHALVCQACGNRIADFYGRRRAIERATAAEQQIERAFKAGYHCRWLKDFKAYSFDPVMSPGDPDGAWAAWLKVSVPALPPQEDRPIV